LWQVERRQYFESRENGYHRQHHRNVQKERCRHKVGSWILLCPDSSQSKRSSKAAEHGYYQEAGRQCEERGPIRRWMRRDRKEDNDGCHRKSAKRSS